MGSDLDELREEARRAVGERRADDARDLLRRFADLCVESKNHREAVGALRTLARIEHKLGRPGQERVLYDEAVALSRGAGEPMLLAHTVRHLGDIFRRSNDMEGALACYSEAIELYRGSPETRRGDLANAVRPMAILQEALGHPTAARALWAEAKELYEGLGIREGVSECADALERLGTA